ncbi:MAG: hypothetical protein K8F25_15510 [Fimbriimonadaceae bacterium]|nr:hypothetical protein [Alphaproteobacteria bacterium]
MFIDLLKLVDENGRSVRAYEICARTARNRAIDEPENSAALFLLAMAAQRFVDSFDDQPITVQEAKKEGEKISGYITSLNDAFDQSDADVRLTALNAVARSLSVKKT